MNENGFLPEIVPGCRDSICGCDIADLMDLIQNLLTWSVYIATLVLVLLLVYVGFLYVTNPTNPSNRSRAKSVAISAVIGFIVVLSAFLIVNTIINTFAKDEFGEWRTFFGAQRYECEQDLIFDPGDGGGNSDVRVDTGGGNASLERLAPFIKAFIETASANGLNAEYEVRTASQRDFLIRQGVPRDNVKHVSRITAPHFSVYSSFGCSGTGSTQCHECEDLGFYGIQTKDGDQAYRFIGEALSRVAQNTEIPGFIVTEAYPKVVNHSCGCHDDGTCVDVNFRF